MDEWKNARKEESSVGTGHDGDGESIWKKGPNEICLDGQSHVPRVRRRRSFCSALQSVFARSALDARKAQRRRSRERTQPFKRR